jgi:hypothetical protein
MSNRKTYAEKLRDPRWQKRRLEILERDGFSCCMCGGNEKELHVHHSIYKRGVEPWEYDDRDLWTLCTECHARVEKAKAEIARRLTFEPALCAVEHLINALNGDPWPMIDGISAINACPQVGAAIKALHEAGYKMGELIWRKSDTEAA